MIDENNIDNSYNESFKRIDLSEFAASIWDCIKTMMLNIGYALNAFICKLRIKRKGE